MIGVYFSCSLGPGARFKRQKDAPKGLDYDHSTHLKHTLMIGAWATSSKKWKV